MKTSDGVLDEELVKAIEEFRASEAKDEALLVETRRLEEQLRALKEQWEDGGFCLKAKKRLANLMAVRNTDVVVLDDTVVMLTGPGRVVMKTGFKFLTVKEPNGN